jgi:CheY-like chemotaxis protein
MAARIAVVNDDTDFLELMRDLLDLEGYDTRTHKVALNAYASLKAENPDLIILDIRMETPEAGWQLLELLRLDPSTVHIPVIVCSADAPFLRSKEAHLLERGCRTLEKPFNLDELLTVVAGALPDPGECGTR